MQPRIFICCLMCVAFVSQLARTQNQDSATIVIISPRVGAVIDAEERKQFGMFRSIKNFTSAVFYISSDSTFFCNVTYNTKSGTQDTVLFYIKILIHVLAEKINHYEDLVTGKYTIGDDPAQLETIKGEVIQPDMEYYRKNTPMKIAQHNDGISVSGKKSNVKRNIYSINETYVSPKDPDILPLAEKYESGKEIEEVDAYPKSSFGYGISTFSPDLSGLDAAFNAIENRYRNSTNRISRLSPEFTIRSIPWYTFRVNISKSLSFLIETANKNDDVNECKAISFSLVYQFNTEEGEIFHYFIGWGIGQYSISGNVYYNNDIDSVSYLEKIAYEGGTTAYSLLGGVDLNLSSSLRINAFIKIISASAIETTLEEGIKATLLFGGISVGGSVELTLW